MNTSSQAFDLSGSLSSGQDKSYALITGASTGIGLALAHEFASHGHNLVLIARSGNRLQKLSQELEFTYKIKCLFIALDLANHTVPYDIWKMCQEKGIVVEYLINNAGFGEYGPFISSQSQKDLGMIDVNMRALTIMTKLFLPEMVARGSGKVMNVASTAAFQPGPNFAVYFATKSYVLSFSEAIAEELTNTGVTVTALCPGPTQSEFARNAHASDRKMFQGKLPTSREVARFGYKAMINGKRVAVHGFMNRFLVFLNRLTPRNLIVKIVKNMLQK